MAKTRNNIILQSAYQITSLIIPFITAPYISRVLGSKNVGIYSYNYSIVNYFMIFLMLGLEAYGSRTIARVRDHKDQLNVMFSELFYSHLLVSGLVLIAYIVYCFEFSGSNKTIALIQTLYIVGQMLNISWLFTGLSEHKTIVTRNILIKLVMIVLVFTLVRTSGDLLKYISILSGDMFVSQALLWRFRKKHVSFVKVRLKDVLYHIKPQIILFVSVVAGSIYRMMDKTMIGRLGFMTELGQYEYADKIIRMPLSVITGVTTVMLPRTANLFANGESIKVFKITKIVIEVITIFSSLMIFGVFAYGEEFCTLYLGQDYSYSGELLMILAPSILFISWNGTLRAQYYIPQLKDRIYVIAVVIGAILNIVLNMMLIPPYGCVGAAIATVLSYLCVSCTELFFAGKDLGGVKLVAQNLIPFFVGVIPFALSFLWKALFDCNTLINLILHIAIFCLEFVLIFVMYLALTHKLNEFIVLIFGNRININRKPK